ncbi:hypothetical protein [Paracidovorax wautersii]|uniref:hypothetical protein n=1 Tax=Paracidovorax wautersii TaxID=1177982 RepID=UPI0031E2E790
MKIPLGEISTTALFHLLQEVAAELAARSSGEIVRKIKDDRPVRVVRVPAEQDADFVLMISARVKSGAYIKAAERERVAQIAQEFGPWVERQGLPTTHNVGDWKRQGAYASRPRAKEK